MEERNTIQNSVLVGICDGVRAASGQENAAVRFEGLNALLEVWRFDRSLSIANGGAKACCAVISTLRFYFAFRFLGAPDLFCSPGNSAGTVLHLRPMPIKLARNDVQRARKERKRCFTRVLSPLGVAGKLDLEARTLLLTDDNREQHLEPIKHSEASK